MSELIFVLVFTCAATFVGTLTGVVCSSWLTAAHIQRLENKKTQNHWEQERALLQRRAKIAQLPAYRIKKRSRAMKKKQLQSAMAQKKRLKQQQQ